MSTDTLTAILYTPPRPSWSEVTWKVHATLVDLPYDERMNKCIYTVSPKNVHFFIFLNNSCQNLTDFNNFWCVKS